MLFRAQHTHAGLSLGPGVSQAVLHQLPAVALALELPGDPQAVDIEVVIPIHRHPGSLQRSILDEHHALGVQLAEHMSLPEPLPEPDTLGLHTGVRLLAADDAAQMLPVQIFFC